MCRTPHGVRELKPFSQFTRIKSTLSRTPHGVRELKLVRITLLVLRLSRTPHGVRELKQEKNQQGPKYNVAPHTGCVN